MKKILFIIILTLLSQSLKSQDIYKMENQNNIPKIELKLILENMCLNLYNNDKNLAKNNPDDISFEIYYVSIKNNWACLFFSLKTKDQFVDPSYNIFKKINGKWENLTEEIRMMLLNNNKIESDFELLDLPNQHSKISYHIIHLYPDCPMDIFKE